MTTHHVTASQLAEFKASWSCHGIADDVWHATFTFAPNGDLIGVELWDDRGHSLNEHESDGPALAALCEDSKKNAPFELAQLKAQAKLGMESDPWGDCMGWWFAVAGELYARCADIPVAWHYRPSPFGSVDGDQYEAEICANATDAALLKFGAILHRYAAKLKRAGKDY